MERSLQKTGFLNLLALLVVGVTTALVARYTHSTAGELVKVFLWLGAGVCLVSWFQMRLEERERLERLDLDEMARGSPGSARLFEAADADTHPARRSREQFEKFFVPGFTLLLLVLEGGLAWWLWRGLAQVRVAPTLNQPLVAMAILGLGALILFVLGQYASRLARLQNHRLLAPGASFVLLGAYGLGLTVAGLAAAQSGLPSADLILARVFCALLGLLAIENVLALLLENFRPRVKGRVVRLLYFSRLVGLMSHPEGIFTTLERSLDYQFGFKVSETWFYQFARRSAFWLAVSYLLILEASTALVYVQPGEEALLERFGNPVAGRDVLGPGFHLKMPWPVDSAYRYRTQEIQTFDIGFEHDEGDKAESVVLWTVSHYKDEFQLLVASREAADSAGPEPATAAGKKAPPVNLLSVGMPVQFQVHDVRAWAYNYSNAGELLKQLATREVVRYLVGVDVNELMSTARFPAAEELRKRIQDRADELKLGVKILFVGLQDVHPPVKVGAAYEKYVGSKQKREADILKAQAYAIRTNALAGAEASRRKLGASAESIRRVKAAEATQSLFTNQMAAYHASPEVYTERARLGTLAQYGSGARKFVRPATNAQEVLQLNLEEKLRDSLLNVPLPPASPKR